MSVLEEIVTKLDPVIVARDVGRGFDDAFIAYRLNSNVVDSYPEFIRVIGHFYNHVFGWCVAKGGNLPTREAETRAEDILEREYRRRGGDIVAAFNDAHDGTDGGVRAILTHILEALKNESVERYVRSVLSLVERNNWEQKVAVIRALMDRGDPHLAMSLHRDTPERLAEHFAEFIREYCEGLRRVSTAMRKY